MPSLMKICQLDKEFMPRFGTFTENRDHNLVGRKFWLGKNFYLQMNRFVVCTSVLHLKIFKFSTHEKKNENNKFDFDTGKYFIRIRNNKLQFNTESTTII